MKWQLKRSLGSICGVTPTRISPVAWPRACVMFSRRYRPIKRPVPLPAFLRACEDGEPFAHGPRAGRARAHRFSGNQSRLPRNDQDPRRPSLKYELPAEDCHFVRQNFTYPNLTNTPTRPPICKCRRGRSKPWRRTNINGFWRNCILRPRSCITAPIGVARSSCAQGSIRQSPLNGSPISFWIFCGRFHAHDHGAIFRCVSEFLLFHRWATR